METQKIVPKKKSGNLDKKSFDKNGPYPTKFVLRSIKIAVPDEGEIWSRQCCRHLEKKIDTWYMFHCPILQIHLSRDITKTLRTSIPDDIYQVINYEKKRFICDAPLNFAFFGLNFLPRI